MKRGSSLNKFIEHIEKSGFKNIIWLKTESKTRIYLYGILHLINSYFLNVRKEIIFFIVFLRIALPIETEQKTKKISSDLAMSAMFSCR